MQAPSPGSTRRAWPGVEASGPARPSSSWHAPTISHGWRLQTTDGVDRFTLVGSTAVDTLGSLAPFGVASLGIACVAVLFLRTRRRWVLPTASIAFALAAIPLEYEGIPAASTAVLGASLLVPLGALALRLPGGSTVRSFGFAAALAFVALWAIARLLDGTPPASSMTSAAGWPSGRSGRSSPSAWSCLRSRGSR